MTMADNTPVNEIWASLKELAGAAGIPKTRRGLLAKLKRDGVASRVRDKRNGEREYPLAAFPEQTQAWYLRRHVRVGRVSEGISWDSDQIR